MVDGNERIPLQTWYAIIHIKCKDCEIHKWVKWLRLQATVTTTTTTNSHDGVHSRSSHDLLLSFVSLFLLVMDEDAEEGVPPRFDIGFYRY